MACSLLPLALTPIAAGPRLMPNLSCLFSRSCATAPVAPAVVLGGQAALAQGTLRIGMTAADIPLTTGQTDKGGEGQRFMGYTVYDALVNWDLSSADKPSDLVPGLATSWKVDDERQDEVDLQAARGRQIPRRHRVHRRGRGLEPRQAPEGQVAAIRSAPVGAGPDAHSGSRRLQGDRRVHRRNHHQDAGRDAALPARLDHDVLAGAVGEGRQELGPFARHAVGHRPVEARVFVPRERAELVPNKDYWDKARVPKLDKLVLLPLPEANSRVAALRSGQVDWIEAPPPDAIPR